MKIPEDKLERIKENLRWLVDERTSAPWAAGSYSDSELAQDEQDYEDIERLTTVEQVLSFLQDEGGQRGMLEWCWALDPLGGFNVDDVDADEESFIEYMTKTYGIPKSKFY
jgi:hypothetical protein